MTKMSKKKVYALLVEPNNKPKITKVKEDDKVIKEIAITYETASQKMIWNGKIAE